MNDAEISRRLALAIGWKESDIVDYTSYGYVGIRTIPPVLRMFSYKFPSVIWPIAERFDCFPAKIGEEWRAGSGSCYMNADTAAKAVALAVIKHCEGK